MNHQNKKAVEQWISLISKKELPAIASTVKILDKFSNDDKSSLPMLSKSILHDQALSSCILKLVNSSQRIGHPKITTVSRATVILGMQAVKNVCLTSTLIEALFESEKLTPNSYQKLSELMARSFYAGILAKMLTSEYNDDTQEEVYLAAMLYTIGETAFWSVGGDLAEKLLHQEHLTEAEFDDYCLELIGCTFNSISRGLAKNWNLGSLLEKALDHPEHRTGEIKLIYLANKLSAFITKPPSSEVFYELLEEISQLKNITVAQLKTRINHCRGQAIDMLSSYGATILEENIKPLPTINVDLDNKNQLKLSPEQAQLGFIKELSALTKTSSDINHFFQLSLERLSQVFDFERTVLFIFTQDKQALKARFNFNKNNIKENINISISLSRQPNIMTYMQKTNSNLRVTNYKDKKWLNYISEELEPLVNDGPTAFALVQINQRTIGVISGQHKKSKDNNDDVKFNEQRFNEFCFLVEHLNMCLSIISK